MSILNEDLNDGRERASILKTRQIEKMCRSSHAFVRGNTAQHYEWLHDLHIKLPEGPLVWICGDCHVGNLGPIVDADGHIDIQIRDLDQTVVGNPAQDLVRLAVSLASAARGSDLPGVTTAHMLEVMIHGYEAGLSALGTEEPAIPEPNVVATVRRRALGRRWRDLASERIEDVRPPFPLGNKFWALSDDEKRGVGTLLDSSQIRELILSFNKRSTRATIELRDAAYWIKGCSSLGKLRYAALVHVSGERKDKLSLVDIKEAVPSVVPSADSSTMPPHFGKGSSRAPERFRQISEIAWQQAICSGIRSSFGS